MAIGWRSDEQGDALTEIGLELAGNPAYRHVLLMPGRIR